MKGAWGAHQYLLPHPLRESGRMPGALHQRRKSKPILSYKAIKHRDTKGEAPRGGPLHGRATTQQATRRAPEGAPERRSAAPGVPRSAEGKEGQAYVRSNDYHCIVSSEAHTTTLIFLKRDAHGTIGPLNPACDRPNSSQPSYALSTLLLGREHTCHADAGSTDVPACFISDVNVT